MIKFDGALTRLVMRWESMTEAEKEFELSLLAPETRASRWHLIDQPDHEANVRAQGGRG